MRRLSFLLLVVLGCSSSKPPYVYLPYDFKLQWPVKRAKFTRGFQQSPFRSRRHEGIDLASKKGTPILAAHEGVVIFAGRRYSGYGKMIMLEKKPWATLYAHLDKIYVKTGQKIKRGQVIGAMGNTGRSRGVHLHFELMINKKPVDPMDYLKL